MTSSCKYWRELADFSFQKSLVAQNKVLRENTPDDNLSPLSVQSVIILMFAGVSAH